MNRKLRDKLYVTYSDPEYEFSSAYLEHIIETSKSRIERLEEEIKTAKQNILDEKAKRCAANDVLMERRGY